LLIGGVVQRRLLCSLSRGFASPYLTNEADDKIVVMAVNDPPLLSMESAILSCSMMLAGK
jgi:hypothetical protein